MTLRPRQDDRHFLDDISKCIFLHKISVKFVHKGAINNKSVLVQVMAWRRPGDKPLPESMLIEVYDANTSLSVLYSAAVSCLLL